MPPYEHHKPYMKWYVSTNNYSKNMVWKFFHGGNSKKFCQHVGHQVERLSVPNTLEDKIDVFFNKAQFENE